MKLKHTFIGILSTCALGLASCDLNITPDWNTCGLTNGNAPIQSVTCKSARNRKPPLKQIGRAHV